MRVVFVCTQMEAAGVQVLASNMAEKFIADGVDASVVYLYRKRPAFDDKSYSVVMSPHKPKGFQYISTIFGLWKYIKANKPNAIIGMARYSSPIACVLGMLTGVRVRLGTQTNPPQTIPLPGRLLDLVCGLLGVYTSNIAASNMVMDCFSDYPASYRRSLKVIYNGIKSRRSSLSKEEARDKFGLKRGVPLIISLGRLSRQKNQKLLVSAVAKLPGVHLAILGEGELRAELTEQVRELGCEDRVHLIGEVPPDAVPDFLKAGDVFAFPSRYEAFGLAIVEAMDAGLPVVCSDHKALTEVVGDAGVVLSIDDEREWVASLTRLIQDNDLAAAFAERSKDRARVFSFDEMYRGFYDEVHVSPKSS